MYLFIMSDWALLITSFSLVPQIIHKALRGHHYKVNPYFIHGLIVSRSFLLVLIYILININFK